MTPGNTADRGLPTNVDAARFVLGSILLDDSFYIQAAGALESDDFSLEKHRRIFRRMGDLSERAERIDRVTVANELMKFNELEACDGLSYLVSLDDGLPQMDDARMEQAMAKANDKATRVPKDFEAKKKAALAQREFEAAFSDLSAKEIIAFRQLENEERIVRLKEQLEPRKVEIAERRIALLEDSARQAKEKLSSLLTTHKGGLTPETLQTIEEAANLL